MQGADLTSRAKAFQMAGADERKARPVITVFVRKALRRLVSADERSSRCGTQKDILEWRYGGSPQSRTLDISSWMTANLLSLNPTKTEFMLIGLPQQITKISNPSLSLPSNHPITPTDSAGNLGFIFDSSLTFLNRFHLYLVIATIISTIFAASGTLSISKQHPLSLLLLYILN